MRVNDLTCLLHLPEHKQRRRQEPNVTYLDIHCVYTALRTQQPRPLCKPQRVRQCTFVLTIWPDVFTNVTVVCTHKSKDTIHLLLIIRRVRIKIGIFNNSRGNFLSLKLI